MKKLTLQRFIHDKVTFGKIKLEWVPEHNDLYTIELPWNDNKPDISCIPQGLYNLTPHNSENHINTYELLNVPNRSNVLIHSGNFACVVTLAGKTYNTNTQGCILIGFGIEEDTPMITRSKEAMDYLRSFLGKDNCSIEVKN